MTDTETTETTTPERPTADIVFAGRQMFVHFPTEGQLLVWSRTVKQLQNVPGDDWTVDTVMKALNRARDIIGTLLVDPQDGEWLDDQMLAGTVDVQQLASIIQLTIEAFEDQAAKSGNRAERREAAKPAKKAARRKVKS